MIYFIRASDDTGLIKIGHSVNPLRRLGEIQLMCPIQLKIIKVIEGDWAKEQSLHHRFRQTRCHGEWFRPTGEIMGLILKSPTVQLPIESNAGDRCLIMIRGRNPHQCHNISIAGQGVCASHNKPSYINDIR